MNSFSPPSNIQSVFSWPQCLLNLFALLYSFLLYFVQVMMQIRLHLVTWSLKSFVFPLAMLHGSWDPSSLTGDGTWSPAVKALSPNYRSARELPQVFFLTCRPYISPITLSLHPLLPPPTPCLSLFFLEVCLLKNLGHLLSRVPRHLGFTVSITVVSFNMFLYRLYILQSGNYI